MIINLSIEFHYDYTNFHHGLTNLASMFKNVKLENIYILSKFARSPVAMKL